MGQELILFQENHITTRVAAAKRLRDLADKIEKLAFDMGDHAVNLPEKVEMKIEFDPDDDNGGEIELEIHWEPWDDMPISGYAAMSESKDEEHEKTEVDQE